MHKRWILLAALAAASACTPYAAPVHNAAAATHTADAPAHATHLRRLHADRQELVSKLDDDELLKLSLDLKL